jgi:hypothetical protein
MCRKALWGLVIIFAFYERNTTITENRIYYISYMPSLMAARSKEWVCGCVLTGIAGSNPAGGMEVCVLSMLCVVR